MFTFETTDKKEARRFRIAQFNGRLAAARSAGLTVSGHVRSVLECKSSVPTRWSITIVPAAPKIRTDALRPAFRARTFAEDLY